MQTRFRHKLAPLSVMPDPTSVPINLKQQTPESDPVEQQMFAWADMSYGNQKLFTGQTKRVPPPSKFMTKFMVDQNIKKFLYKLRKFQMVRRHVPYSKLHLTQINDQATGEVLQFNNHINVAQLHKVEKKVTFRKRMRKLIHRVQIALRQTRVARWASATSYRILKSIPVMNPDSNYKITWDCMMFFIDVGIIILIPVEACIYQGIFFVYPYNILFALLLVLQFIDLLINSNTSQFINGELISRRSAIFHYQVENGLIFKVISIFVFVFFFIYQQQLNPYEINYSKLSLFVFYHYIGQLYNFKEKFESLLDLSPVRKSFYEIGKLLITLIFINHIFSCIWILIGRASIMNNLDSWLDSENPRYQYVNAMYYTHVTMTSVGYGDVSPKNYYEKLFCIFFLLASSLCLSYGIGTVGSIISQLFASKDQEISKLRVINQFMRKNNLEPQFQNRIRQYLKYKWRIQRNDQTEEELGIINDLSHEVRNELRMRINKKILHRSAFLSDNFSTQLVQALAVHLNFTTIAHENKIEFGEDPWLMYIENGSVQSYIEKPNGERLNTGVPFDTYPRGQFFGVQDFILGRPARLSYQSLGFTKVHFLPRSVFLATLAEFPEDLERYHAIIDEVKINRDYTALKQQCLSCFQYRHPMDQCQYLQFKPDRERIIKSVQFPVKNERRHRIRNVDRVRHLHHAIKHSQYVEQVALEIQEEYQEFQNIYAMEPKKPTIAESPAARTPFRSMDHKGTLRLPMRQNTSIDNPRRGSRGLIRKVTYSHFASPNRSICESDEDDEAAQEEYWASMVSARMDNIDAIDELLNERHQVEWLHLRLKPSEDVLQPFEVMKDYKHYNPEYNHEVRVQAANSTVKAAPQSIRSYMFYPNDFLRRYRSQWTGSKVV